MLASLLATWLTHQAQLRSEVRSERAAAAAEHRQANRQLCMDALELADLLRDRVGARAIVASLYCQGSSAGEAWDSDRWGHMRAVTEDLESRWLTSVAKRAECLRCFVPQARVRLPVASRRSSTLSKSTLR